MPGARRYAKHARRARAASHDRDGFAGRPSVMHASLVDAVRPRVIAVHFLVSGLVNGFGANGPYIAGSCVGRQVGDGLLAGIGRRRGDIRRFRRVAPTDRLTIAII